MTGGEANKQLAQRLVELTTTEEHGEYYDSGGSFLPLSVWATMGYDPDVIKTGSLPKDKKSHPVLGDTYRVCVLQSGHRGSKKVAKSDKLVASSGSGGDTSQLALEGLPAPLAIADKSSSGSDSSSSSSRKKSKKSKKAAKKSKKAARKLKRKRSSSPPKASLSSNWFWGSSIIKRPSR